MVAEMLRENAQEVKNIHTENIHTFQLLQARCAKSGSGISLVFSGMLFVFMEIWIGR